MQSFEYYIFLCILYPEHYSIIIIVFWPEVPCGRCDRAEDAVQAGQTWLASTAFHHQAGLTSPGAGIYIYL